MKARAHLIPVAGALQLFVACTSASEPHKRSSPLRDDRVTEAAEALEAAFATEKPSLHGRWLLFGAEEQMVLQIDTLNKRMIADKSGTFDYAFHGDSLTLRNLRDGQLTTGRITRLRKNELRITWTSGDLDVYRRLSEPKGH